MENKTKSILLNLGSGPVQPEGWINVDGSRRCLLVKSFPNFDRFMVKIKLLPPTEFTKKTFYQNLCKKLKFKTCFADAIYCGEILEHFSYEDGLSFLRECYRVLKPNGVIRICVPDNYVFWKTYIKFYDDLIKTKADERKEDDVIKYVKMMFDNIKFSSPFYKPNFCHKWAYDELSLELQLKKANFIDCRRKGFHDSEIRGVEKVERSNYLIMEAKKGF